MSYFEALRAYLAGDKDAINRYRESKRRGPATRPDDGFISDHRKDGEPGTWKPPYTNRESTIDFAALYQGRVLGHQPQGLGAELPTVLPRGTWQVVVDRPGHVAQQFDVTGAGGSRVKFTTPMMALCSWTVTDQWKNKCVVMMYSPQDFDVTLSFRNSGNGRLVYCITR